jgi:hypothetical protein
VPDTTQPPKDAAIAGPGSIAARQTDGAGRAPDAAPSMAQPQGGGTPAVGTPRAADQTGPAPAADGLSGKGVNDQQPGGGAVSGAERAPPDMQETPDPRGDARDPPPRR